MAKFLKDIPVEGKVVGFREDTVFGGSLLFPRRELRILLIVRNEILKVDQSISFVRPGGQGNILGTLIDDFKVDEKLNVKGKISYQIDVSSMMPRDFKKLLNDVKHLAGTANWEKIHVNDRAALRAFLGRIISPHGGEINLKVSVGKRIKYLIYKEEGWVGSADIYLY